MVILDCPVSHHESRYKESSWRSVATSVVDPCVSDSALKHTEDVANEVVQGLDLPISFGMYFVD